MLGLHVLAGIFLKPVISPPSAGHLTLDQWFPNFAAHLNHLEELLKIPCPDFIPPVNTQCLGGRQA